jgi:protein-S-isoprenylcysteine O-methyltransferase Ste14
LDHNDTTSATSRFTLNSSVVAEESHRIGTAGSTLRQRLRVPLGFAFGIVYIVFSDPSTAAFWPGLGFALLGLSIRLWAAGHLHKHEDLATSGPYRFTRNPLYFGSFVMGLGFTLASGRLWILLLFLALFLAVYLPVMRAEVRELEAGYGHRFRRYAYRVPLFIPLLRPAETETEGHFSWRQVRKNREYNAVVGYLLLCLFLLAKRHFL